jgi:hypothetical protein
MRRVSVALVGVALAALVGLTGVPMLHDAPIARAADLGAAAELTRAPASAESCSGSSGCVAPTLLWRQSANVYQSGYDEYDSGGINPYLPVPLCSSNAGAGQTAVAAAAALSTATCQQGSEPSGNGVATGNVVQLPIQNVPPIQVCNNNVATGLIAVSGDAQGGKACP